MWLRVTCDEPGGPVVRTVLSVPCTDSAAWKIYERIKGLPNFVSADSQQLTPESMLWLFLPQVQYYLVDDVGVIVLRVQSAAHGDVHVTFWDKRLRGREKLASSTADAIIKEKRLEYLETYIPKDSRAILAFAKRVGFEQLTPEDSDVHCLVYRSRAR
jgi:hypothetical protein